MRKTIWAALAAAGFVAAGGGVAWATGLTSFGFVGNDGTITACVQTSNGNVRFIDPSSGTNDLSTCRASEAQVLLNQGTSQGPASVTVDCTANPDGVQQALDANANAASVDVTIHGVCNPVHVNRDRVGLHAAGAGDGLAAPSGAGEDVLDVNGGRYVHLDGLTLSGGQTGLSIGEGGQVNANGLTVSGVSGEDVRVGDSSSLNLNGATLTGGQEGVATQNGSSASISGGTISDVQTFSVHAQNGGSAMLGGGLVVSGDSFHAVVAQDSGTVLVRDATVENSSGTGVFAFQGGSVFVTQNALVQGNRQCGVVANAGVAEVDGHVTGNDGCGVGGYNGGHVTIQDGAVVNANNGDGVQAGIGSTVVVERATIENNHGNGVHLAGTSSAGFNDTNTIAGNDYWGIFCDGPPAVAQIQTPQPGTDVSGNGSGGIDCPET